jgi:23S rRNA (cytosine1962-C5)-methyltransferase
MDTKQTMFENRLTKMYRHHKKWAKGQGITCYRIYDDDIPEFPFAIDVYENYLHAAEYERNHTLTPEIHTEWLENCRLTMAKVTETPISQVFLKTRRQQKGLQQYEKYAQAEQSFTAQEAGLKFIVNLSDFLDTGLFLDHRNTRSMVRAASEDKNVLNLFAYTGAFSVYAAAGGAKLVTTVDLSNTYIDWAKRNFELNGFSTEKNEFVQADVLQWLRQKPTTLYDIVVFDPPTFSNSKRMDDTLIIQRDYTALLDLILQRTKSGGVIYFSTNFRKFKLDETLIQGATIKDISGQSVPQDFRNKKIHYCFRVEKG